MLLLLVTEADGRGRTFPGRLPEHPGLRRADGRMILYFGRKWWCIGEINGESRMSWRSGIRRDITMVVSLLSRRLCKVGWGVSRLQVSDSDTCNRITGDSL